MRASQQKAIRKREVEADLAVHFLNTGSGPRFSKFLIIYELLLFTCKIEVSIVLHLTRLNYQLMKQNGAVCYPGPALLFFIFRFENLISGPKSYRDFRETGPRPAPTVAHKGHYALSHNIFLIIKKALQIMHNTFQNPRNTFQILRNTF